MSFRYHQNQTHARAPGKSAAQLEIRVNIPLISPVPHLLQSNLPPTDADTQIIQETISIAKQEDERLKKLSDRIPRFTSRAHDANSRRECQKLRKVVQDFIRNHERLFYPLRILPTELLILIFTLYTESLDFDTGLTTSKPTQPLTAALRLSQVCQCWRAIVHDTPELWTILRIDFNTLDFSSNAALNNRNGKRIYDANNADAYIQRLRGILNRSRNHDLQLCLRAYESSYYHLGSNNENVHNTIMDLLSEQAFRFMSLAIHAHPGKIKAFCDVAHSKRPLSNSITFPRLRKLILDLRGSSQTVIDGFALTPALRNVTVWGTVFRLSLPWHQLRTYTEGVQSLNWDGGTLQSVLTSATNLKSFHLTRLNYYLTPRVSHRGLSVSRPTKVTHISLEFPATNNNFVSTCSLFTYFDYSAIQSLRLTSSYNLLEVMLSIANEHYPQSPAPLSGLTKLYYRSTVRANPSNTISFLCLCPNLEEFDVEVSSYANFQTFVSLYGSSDPTTCQNLVPALKKFSIYIKNLWTRSNIFVEQLLQLKKATTILRSIPHRSTLPELRLFFEDDDSDFRKVESYLNNRIISTTPPSHSTILTKWREELHAEVPLVGTATRRFAVHRFSSIRLSKTLEEIANYRLSSADMQQLYLSGLHLSLDRLKRLKDDLLPGESTHQFRSKARKILDRWEPLHRKDLCSPKTMTLWALKGKRSLVFIHPNDPRRKGPDAMKLIYGMDDDAVEDI